MNNPSNNPRHQDPSNPSRGNNLQNDYFMRQQDRPDLAHHGKPDPKMDFENINDLFMNNLLRNPGSLNQFFDKSGQGQDFFNPSSANPQNLPFDPNLLYNFPNMASNPKMNPTGTQGNPLDQNGLYFPNMNNNFMLPPNFGLTNPNLYEDLLKNSNQAHGQVDMNDKNLFNHGLLSENPGLMEGQFMFDELNHKPQDGNQASNQQNSMGGLNSLQNQMLLNNLAYGSDLGLNSFLLSGMSGMPGMPGMSGMSGMPGMPGMPGFGIEDLYNMQMPGGVPPGQMSHNIGSLPMDLKVENANQMHQKAQHQQQQLQQQQQQQQQQQHQQGNGAANARNSNRAPQEASQANTRPEQKNPNSYANQNNNSQQDMGILNGLGPKSMSMQMPMGNNLGMLNFPMPGMQSMQSMLLPKDMEAQQTQLLKFMSSGMDGSLGNDSLKQTAQNMPNGMQHSSNGAQNPLYNVSKDAKPQNDDSKSNMANLGEPGKAMWTPNEIDMIGKGLLDPFTLKKSSLLDPLGLDDPSFLEAHSSLYNKMKEKNRYERSLKIERYKNKKRNWAKKIAYDCRKRVADTRLRIKGRFISKKDSEKIQQLVGKQEEAFNEKKNLNLDYLTNKFNISGEAEEKNGAVSGRPNISRGYLLNKIDEILHNNKNPLPPKNLANNMRLSNIIISNLQAQSKKIFKIKSRRDDRELSIMRDLSNGSVGNQPPRQEVAKNMPKVKNEAYTDAIAQLNPMNQLGNMDNQMLANRFKNFYPNFPGAGNEGFDMNAPNPEMDPHSMPNMNMLEAMALSMGMNMSNIGNMANMANMGMGMRLNPFETRPELQHEEAGHEMARFK